MNSGGKYSAVLSNLLATYLMNQSDNVLLFSSKPFVPAQDICSLMHMLIPEIVAACYSSVRNTPILKHFQLLAG